ncbi:MAG: glyoxalase [Cyanobacteria bacterium K_Offshore_surface_m2_239]|nr:glyoxalase [Cyanobacteria bacterium K_Offshore_surface_m2_239]
MAAPCFHLSIPSADLARTERWYVEGLGCAVGRRSADALILNLGGHQLVAQRTSIRSEPPQNGIYPRHFGLVFAALAAWDAQRKRALQAGLRFGVEPKLRFEGDVLEHHTFFLIDPDLNWLEFKHYSDPEAIFGCHDRVMVGDDVWRRKG